MSEVTPHSKSPEATDGPRSATPQAAGHAEWRALVEKELAGKSFDRVLLHEALPGLLIEPLYSKAPAIDAAGRFERSEPFRVCMRYDASCDDVENGADALWMPLGTSPANRPELSVFDVSTVPSVESLASIEGRFWVAADPLAWRAMHKAGFDTLSADLEALGELGHSGHPVAVVSTSAYHEAGADVGEELSLGLATAVVYLEALVEAGLSIEQAARAIWFQISIGRDTFVEVCKSRALRLCWSKILAASGCGPHKALVHAVCSAQTLSQRDPWVNIMRVTTQVFAAMVGGADMVTPTAFDEAFGIPSALGRRLARNTGLILREESLLGKVSDPTGGAWYFDTLTDTLARRAWLRFQEVVRQGGMAAQLKSGDIAEGLRVAWTARLKQLSTRKLPVLGVSDFANLDEQLPQAVVPDVYQGGLPRQRDAAAFEALRNQADAMAPEVLLLTLGTFGQSRARVGFATTFFAAGGLRTREVSTATQASVACICGTDERYTQEGVACAEALKRAGVKTILLAGRPGPLEASLRAAGVDSFIHVGCDVVATLTDILHETVAS